MVRKAVQLYCDNEHGVGDVIFPDEGIFDYANHTAEHIRREARKAGWRRVQGADYCPTCVDLMKEERQEQRRLAGAR